MVCVAWEKFHPTYKAVNVVCHYFMNSLESYRNCEHKRKYCVAGNCARLKLNQVMLAWSLKVKELPITQTVAKKQFFGFIQ